MLRGIYVIRDAASLSNLLKRLFGELIRASVYPEDSPIATIYC